jgi:hypothetical protein
MSHERFVNKRRRSLNLREPAIGNILPEHFADLYPKFITMLKKYYEFQDQNDSTELLNHLFATRDINETDITLLTYIEDELLLGESYFQKFGSNETELRAAANFSNTLFRSKGSKFAIEWFFRSFYGEDVEVLYPKENVFKIGETDSQIGADSLKYITDDKLYQTFALLIRVGVPIAKWRETFKLFVHPAGMYLGGEVFIVDDVSVDLQALEVALLTYNTPVYSASVNATTQNEGTDFVFTLTGTNVPDGIDALYWYGVHGTTDDADFGINSYDQTTGLPDANNKQYFEINGSSGTFSVVSVIDLETAVAEGDETFTIYIEDGDGRAIDNFPLTITDLIPSYTISTDAPGFTTSAGDTSDEGTTVTFTVNGTNVPNAGSAILKWYVDFGASNATDQTNFETSIPTSPGTAQDVTIIGSTGSFQIKSRVDGVINLNSNYVIKLLNENNIEKVSRVQYLTQVVPTLTVASGVTVNEGNNLEITITSGGYNAGKDIDYAITGAITSDGRIATADLTGSVTMIDDGLGGSTAVTSIPVSATETYESPTLGTFTATDNNLNTGAEISDDETFTVNDGPPAYTITGSPAVGQDGGSITYTVGGQNIPDGTVYFYINDIDTDDADWVGTPPRNGSRLAVTVSGGTGTVTNPTAYSADGDTADNFYQVFVYDQASGGTELAEGNRIIAGTSNTVTITPSDLAPEEGDTITVDVTLGGDYQDTGSGGVYKYWIAGTNITSSDFDSGYSNISTPVDLTITSSTGQISLAIANDFKTEGSETFTVVVGEETAPSSNVFAIIGESAGVVVDDTSKPTYTLSVPSSIGEEANFTPQVNCVEGTEAEQLYIEITGTGASQYTTTQQNSPGTTAGNVKTFTFVTNGDNATNEADRTITTTVRRGSHVGTILAGPSNTTLTDAQVYTLSASDTTPDEATTVTFTVTGPDGTYYYRPQGFEPVTVNTFNGGTILTTAFATSSYSTLATGHTQRTTGINGVINNINSGSLTMTATSTGAQTAILPVFASVANYAYFDGANDPTGTVVISGGTGTFDVDITTSAVQENKAFVYELHDVQENVNSTVLASETITIQNVAGNGILGYTVAPVYSNYPKEAYEVLFDTQGPVTAIANVRFDDDGFIYARGREAFSSFPGSGHTPDTDSYSNIGSWISGGTGPYTGYKLYATKGSTDGGTSGGSFGTFLDIGNNTPEFSLSFTATSYGAITRQLEIDFLIYEAAAPGNNITIDWTLYAGVILESFTGEGFG